MLDDLDKTKYPSPQSDHWLAVSLDEIQQALTDEGLPSEYTSQLLSILKSRCRSELPYPLEDQCSFDPDEDFMKILRVFAHKRIEETFQDIENLFTQLWPGEGLHHETIEVITDAMLAGLLRYHPRESTLFLSHPGYEFGQDDRAIYLEVGSRALDFSQYVDEILDDRFLDDEGSWKPFSQEEYQAKLEAIPYHRIGNGSVLVEPYEVGSVNKSALEEFGYCLEKLSSMSSQDRYSLLEAFFEANFLDQRNSCEDHQNIGEAGSGSRLGYVVAVIATNIVHHFDNDPEKYRDSIVNWLEDLDYLGRRINRSSGGWWPSIPDDIYTYYGCLPF